MNRTQAQIALLKFSLITCAILAVALCVSILDSRPSHSPSVVPELVTDVMRVPASIPALLMDAKVEAPRANFKIWTPACLSSGRRPDALTTESRWLRLTTGTCDESEQILESRLENKSNGYVATVFQHTPSRFTSDFIPLAAGNNQLTMELTFASGERLDFQWSVQRQPTASN